MNLLKRKFTSLLLAFAVMVSFTGCSLLGVFDPVAYIEYELESVYHNVHAQELVDMYTDGTTMADLELIALDNAALEAELFLSEYAFVETDYISQETLDRATEIFMQIYQKVQFEVLESNEVDGNYHVSVKLHPVDTVYNGLTEEDFMAILDEVYPTANTEVTAESETAFANLILDKIESYIPSTQNTEETIATIVIDVTSDGTKIINAESWYNFDAQLIPWA